MTIALSLMVPWLWNTLPIGGCLAHPLAMIKRQWPFLALKATPAGRGKLSPLTPYQPTVPAHAQK